MNRSESHPTRRTAVTTGATVAVLGSLQGCSWLWSQPVTAPPVPYKAESLSVNCHNPDKVADFLDLSHYTGLPTAQKLDVILSDGAEDKTITVMITGRIALNDEVVYTIDNEKINKDDAGKTITQLPNAELKTGLPSRRENKYIDAAGGLSFVCLGEPIRDLPPVVDYRINNFMNSTSGG